MTNTSVITYEPSVAGDSEYLQVTGYSKTSPYQSAAYEGASAVAQECLIEVSTGKLVKANPGRESVEEIESLDGGATIGRYSPGSFTVESPDETFWFFAPSTSGSLLNDGVAEQVGEYTNSVSFAGSSSNPHAVTVRGGEPVIDGKEYDAFVAEVEESRNSAVSGPEGDTTSEESGTISGDEPAATEEPADEADDSGDNMVKYDELAAAKGKLIRKALGGFIMVAPMSVSIPEKIFADKQGNFIDFKEAGFTPLGWLTKGDGINFSRETEQSEVESFGAQEPTRVDFTKDTTSAAFNCQETNKKVLELYYSQDLSEVTPDSETGEISFEQRDPETIYRRMIYIAHDGKGKDAKYIVKIMPKATISEVQEQSWSSESELAYGMTAKASKDDELGYSVRHVFGGPGFEKLYADMGFTDGNSSSEG